MLSYILHSIGIIIYGTLYAIKSFFFSTSLFIISGLLFWAFLIWLLKQFKTLNITNKHIIITGGSKGLGLEFAKICFKKGAKVTIIARNKEDLINAKKQILESASSVFSSVSSVFEADKVGFQEADVTNEKEIKEAIENAAKEKGGIDWIVCNAGKARTGFVTSLKPEVFKEQMDVNYLGTVNTTLAALPYLLPPVNQQKEKKENKDNKETKSLTQPTIEKRIICVSSAMGLCAFAGYSPYAPTKWAVRGFCEGLRNELQPYKIGVHIFYASSMDTPGYKEENKEKPLITQRIEQGTVFTASQAANHLFNGIRREEMSITSEVLIDLLRMTVSGISSFNNFPLQLLFSPILPFISFYVKNHWDALVTRFYNQK